MKSQPNLSLIRFAAVALACAFPCLNADAGDHSPVTSVEIFKRDHPEDASKEIIVKRVEFKPGSADVAHVHPGMVTGYVETGTLETQLRGEPLKTFKAGDTFFEPPGSHHMIARNPDTSSKTVLIVFVVNPKGTPVSTPLKE